MRSTREANALNKRNRSVHNCAICVKGTRNEIQSSTFKRADGTPGFGNDSPVSGSTTGGSASTFTVFAIKTKLVPDISVESLTYMFDSFRVIAGICSSCNKAYRALAEKKAKDQREKLAELAFFFLSSGVSKPSKLQM